MQTELGVADLDQVVCHGRISIDGAIVEEELKAGRALRHGIEKETDGPAGNVGKRARVELHGRTETRVGDASVGCCLGPKKRARVEDDIARVVVRVNVASAYGSVVPEIARVEGEVLVPSLGPQRAAIPGAGRRIVDKVRRSDRDSVVQVFAAKVAAKEQCAGFLARRVVLKAASGEGERVAILFDVVGIQAAALFGAVADKVAVVECDADRRSGAVDLFVVVQIGPAKVDGSAILDGRVGGEVGIVEVQRGDVGADSPAIRCRVACEQGVGNDKLGIWILGCRLKPLRTISIQGAWVLQEDGAAAVARVGVEGRRGNGDVRLLCPDGTSANESSRVPSELGVGDGHNGRCNVVGDLDRNGSASAGCRIVIGEERVLDVERARTGRVTAQGSDEKRARAG